MAGFENVRLVWKDTEYPVEPTRCMGLLAAIEDVIVPTGFGPSVLDILGNPHRAKLTTLAKAYAAALRYAGCQVTQEEVYLSLQREMMKGEDHAALALRELSMGLLQLFFPDWAAGEEMGKDEAPPE